VAALPGGDLEPTTEEGVKANKAGAFSFVNRLEGSRNQGLPRPTLAFPIGLGATSPFCSPTERLKDALHLGPIEVGAAVAVPSLSAAYGVLSLGLVQRFRISNPDRNSGTGDVSQVPGAGFSGGELP